MRITRLVFLVTMSVPRGANAQLASPVGFTPHTGQLDVVGNDRSPSWRMYADTTHSRPLWPGSWVAPSLVL